MRVIIVIALIVILRLQEGAEGSVMKTIDTKTKDCPDCGMGLLGYLQLQVC